MHWVPALVLAAAAVALPSCRQAEALSPQAPEAGARPRAEPRPAAATAGLEVRYVANEGFLVEGGGKRVLVDGLFGPGVTGYPVSPTELRRELEQGDGEWAGIQVALATHFHRDHFDPDSVARFLAANPKAVFVSTPQAIERLRRSRPDDPGLLARARAVFPADGTVDRLEIDGIEIDVLNLHHGRRDPPVENLGFVVSLGESRFLHFGDTEAEMRDFEPYLEGLRDVDVGLLPFWFLASEWRAEMVRDLIRPRWIVVAHMPVASASAGHFGRWRSYDNLIQVIRAGFPEARFPRMAGEAYRYPPD